MIGVFWESWVYRRKVYLVGIGVIEKNVFSVEDIIGSSFLLVFFIG